MAAQGSGSAATQRSGVGSAASAVQGRWQRQRSGGCAGFGSAAAAELGVGSGSTAAAARVDIQPCRALAAAAQLGSEGVAAAAQRQHHRALSAAAQQCLHRAAAAQLGRPLRLPDKLTQSFPVTS